MPKKPDFSYYIPCNPIEWDYETNKKDYSVNFFFILDDDPKLKKR